jgi:hypothetical protein
MKAGCSSGADCCVPPSDVSAAAPPFSRIEASVGEA